MGIRAFVEHRPHWVSILALFLATGCAPTLDVQLSLESGCALAGTPTTRVFQLEGRCSREAVNGAREEEIFPPDAAVEDLAPGTHCVGALAYRSMPEARVCRLDAYGDVERTLPRERDDINVALSCVPPSDTSRDELLWTAAHCNGACDVERCNCAASCAINEAGSVCPRPVSVERVVMGDTFACGLNEGGAGVTCWGTALPGVGALTPGVARAFASSALGDPDGRYGSVSASPTGWCRDTNGFTRCNAIDGRATEVNVDTAEEAIPAFTRAFVAGDGFVCRGQHILGCNVGGQTLRIRTSSFVSVVSSGRHVCVLNDGVIRCADPLAPTEACFCLSRVGACADAGTCPAVWAGTLRGNVWIDMNAGWDRVCGITRQRTLHCWAMAPESRPANRTLPLPDARTDPPDMASVQARVPPQIHWPAELGRFALEVSVGAEHICVRTERDVFCGVPELEGGQWNLVAPQRIPSQGTNDDVTSFTAGPRGVTCAVRRGPDDRLRVECFQLASFSQPGTPEPLLGHAHTRNLDLSNLDPDRGDLAVCP